MEKTRPFPYFTLTSHALLRIAKQLAVVALVLLVVPGELGFRSSARFILPLLLSASLLHHLGRVLRHKERRRNILAGEPR